MMIDAIILTLPGVHLMIPIFVSKKCAICVGHSETNKIF